jgi:hypothetical protein
MSTKRLLGITLFGLLFIVAVVGFILLNLYIGRESEAVPLPDLTTVAGTSEVAVTDTLDRVEVTKETIQAVVSELSRPQIYSRNVKIESFWDGGNAEYIFSVLVMNDLTSLMVLPPLGIEKRIIITPERLYIWYKGDRAPYIGNLESSGDGYRTADEWQMLVTYEDLLELDKNNIIDAGYTNYNGENCVFAVYRSTLLENTGTFYISLDQGLVIGAEEFDKAGDLIYSMTAGECVINEVDPAAFTLPDGTVLAVET